MTKFKLVIVVLAIVAFSCDCENNNGTSVKEISSIQDRIVAKRNTWYNGEVERMMRRYLLMLRIQRKIKELARPKFRPVKITNFLRF